jgi:hypothetical protein
MYYVVDLASEHASEEDVLAKLRATVGNIEVARERGLRTVVGTAYGGDLEVAFSGEAWRVAEAHKDMVSVGPYRPGIIFARSEAEAAVLASSGTEAGVELERGVPDAGEG